MCPMCRPPRHIRRRQQHRELLRPCSSVPTGVGTSNSRSRSPSTRPIALQSREGRMLWKVLCSSPLSVAFTHPPAPRGSFFGPTRLNPKPCHLDRSEAQWRDLLLANSSQPSAKPCIPSHSTTRIRPKLLQGYRPPDFCTVRCRGSRFRSSRAQPTIEHPAFAPAPSPSGPHHRGHPPCPIAGLVILLVLLGVLAPTALARRSSRSPLSLFGTRHHTSPRADETAGDIACAFCVVNIHGNVSGDVATLFGTVNVEPSRSIGGDVALLFGTLRLDEDATVRGDLASLFSTVEIADKHRHRPRLPRHCAARRRPRHPARTPAHPHRRRLAVRLPGPSLPLPLPRLRGKLPLSRPRLRGTRVPRPPSSPAPSCLRPRTTRRHPERSEGSLYLVFVSLPFGQGKGETVFRPSPHPPPPARPHPRTGSACRRPSSSCAWTTIRRPCRSPAWPSFHWPVPHPRPAAPFPELCH